MTTMHSSEDGIKSSGGDSLFVHHWEPASPASAVLLLVHGAGEHGGRYREFARYATDRGFALATFDQIGHGRSGGKPGYVDSFDQYVKDLGLFDGYCRRRYPGQRFFLLGHSLGGLIACHYLLTAQARFSGAALSGPLLALDPAPGVLQRWAARVLGSALPHLGVLQLDASGVSRDPAVVADYRADPLVFHGKLSARFLREMFQGMDALAGRAGELTLPLLVQHGGQDSMTAPAGSRRLCELTAAAGSRLQVYDALFHEIYNEPEKALVLRDLFDWLQQQSHTAAADAGATAPPGK